MCTNCSFTWKRKAKQDVCKKTAKLFAVQLETDDDDVLPLNLLGDELLLRPQRRIGRKGNDEVTETPALEDVVTKAKRLQQEGCILAENDRLWEAIRRWNEAIQLTPTDEKLHEMKAQALMELQETLLAVQEAEVAVRLKPTWWIAYQTLGRAQLGLGEVSLAIKSFSQACHLNPDVNELWEDDMKWALSLREKLESTAIKESLVQEQDHGVQKVETSKLLKDSWIWMRTS